MSRSLVSLVHGRSLSERAARAMLSGGRASSSRSSTPVGAPAMAHTYTPVRSLPTVAPGLVRVRHIGEWPHLVSCTCTCHGNGDASGASCDVTSCVDAVRV